MVEQGVEEAREVAVQALVAGDELVREGEPGHEAALLEPEDGAEGAGEEDALGFVAAGVVVCLGGGEERKQEKR